MRDYKKYDIWKLSHQLTLDIYKLASTFPKSELYGISSQIKRAASSIATNIVEGCERDSETEFNRFLTIAQGSASETEYLLILGRDLDFINKDDSVELIKKTKIIKKKIYSLKEKLI